MNIDPTNFKNSWRNRRRYLWVNTLAILGGIGYILGTGNDTQAAQTVVDMGIFSIIVFVLSYVFGASIDDYLTNKLNKK